MKAVDVIAVDIGYNHVKVLSADLKEKYPSIVVRAERDDLSVNYVFSANRSIKHEMVIELNGSEYLVGNIAMEMDGVGGELDFNKTRFKTGDIETVKLLAALLLISQNENLEIQTLS